MKILIVITITAAIVFFSDIIDYLTGGGDDWD
jgi:hypothetical protein